MVDGTIKLERMLNSQKLTLRISPEFEKLAGEQDTLFLVYDMTNADSFEHIKNYLSSAKKINYHSTFIIGNKLDFEDERVVTREDG